MTGNSLVTCGSDRAWHETLPTCTPVRMTLVIQVDLWQKEHYPTTIQNQVAHISDSDTSTCLQISKYDQTPNTKVFLVTLSRTVQTVSGSLKPSTTCPVYYRSCSTKPLLVHIIPESKSGQVICQEPCHPFCEPPSVCQYNNDCTFNCQCPAGNNCSKLAILHMPMAPADLTFCHIEVFDVVDSTEDP